jgi:tripartite-type tricarboxylate transporter receptor subunit TctC
MAKAMNNRQIATAAILSLGLLSSALSQVNRTTIEVPFTAGGTVDIFARVIAQVLSQR